MKNIGICSEANFDANGAHCFFPSLEEVVYIPAKFTCFIKNLMCGNCITESKVSYNQKSCVEAAPVGTSEELASAEMQIFPNPVKKSLQIMFSIKKEQTIHIEMLDVTGSKILSLLDAPLAAGNYNQTFELPEGISKGIYFIKWSGDRSVTTSKILIQ